MACALHAVDVDTTAHMVIQTPKGVVQRTITALIEFIRELGYKGCIIRSDNEPAITAMTAEVGKQREEETVVEEIQVANSRAVGVVERGNRTVGSLARAYRSAFDKNYGFQLMPAVAVILAATPRSLGSEQVLCGSRRPDALRTLQGSALHGRGLRALREGTLDRAVSKGAQVRESD